MIERYTNKKSHRPCPPVAYGSLRVGCASLPSARLRLTPRRLRLLGMAYRPKVWGLTPQPPNYVAVSLQRRRRFAPRANDLT